MAAMDPNDPLKQFRKDFHQKIFKNPPETVVALGEAAGKKAGNAWHRELLLGILAGCTSSPLLPPPLLLLLNLRRLLVPSPSSLLAFVLFGNIGMFRFGKLSLPIQRSNNDDS